MPDQPLISVVIPAYNSATYLAEAVASALGQPGLRIEVIVVDDGSTDGTRSMVGETHQQLKYVRQEHLGAPQARNRGLRESAGDYVTFLDADDYLLPGSLRHQVDKLRSSRKLGMVHSGWRLVDEGGRPLEDVEPWIEAPKLSLKTWLMWKPVFLGSMMFRRGWLERVGEFATELSQTDDIDLVLRLALLGCQARWNPRVTVCRRKHTGNMTLDGARQARDLVAAIDRFYALPRLPRSARRTEDLVRYYTYLWIVWYLYETGFTDSIPGYLRKSLQHSPYPAEHAVFAWHTEYSKRLRAAGRAPEEVRNFWRHFQVASDLDPAEWEALAPLLEWWTSVWSPYALGEFSNGRASLQDFRWTRPRDAMKTAQLAIASGPFPLDLEVVRRYWQDLQASGQVQGSHPDLLTSLYLTAFARSFFAHRWGLAGVALGKALVMTRLPGAWPAWLRFLRSGLGYLLRRLGVRLRGSGFSPRALDPNTPLAVPIKLERPA